MTIRFNNGGISAYKLNSDYKGSVTTIINEQNNGICGYKYDEFGNTEMIGDTNFNNEVCYTGQIYDKETGNYYYNARYYNPQNGRFITMDTYRGELEEPLSLHLYAYCANDPINYTDPSGHKMVHVHAKVSFYIGLSNYAAGRKNRFAVIMVWSANKPIYQIKAEKIIVSNLSVLKYKRYFNREVSFLAGSSRYGTRTLGTTLTIPNKEKKVRVTSKNLRFRCNCGRYGSGRIYGIIRVHK
ncbi:RHS repeat domain-containing protein [Anaerofustis butyriciformans]|uniref:RHS repeat domain-containing protein n=1 Tax=Anaerofustis butyriciformans TaxID=3108533 RepID=UPI003F8B9ED9